MQSILTVLNHIAYTDVEAKQNSLLTPACVSVGRVGSGKTSFVNKVCGVNLETQSSGSSCTKYVFMRDADYEKVFKVFDTPGTGTRQEKIQHALNLKSALVEQPINRILLFIQYDCRFVNIQEEIERQLTIFEDFKEMITLIITHWDQLSQETIEKKKQVFTELVKLINKEYEISSIICIGKDSPQDRICDAVYKNISQCAQKQIKIDEETFAKKFDLVELSKEMKGHLTKSIHEFKILFEQYKNLIKAYTDEDKDDFLHCIQQDFKIKSEEFAYKFENQYGKQMLEADSYLYYIELKKQMLPYLQSFNKLVQLQMSYNLSLQDHENKQQLLRKCKNCGLIWFKIDGCENTTTCGNRSDLYDNFRQFFVKFMFKYENGKLIWKREKQIKKIEQKKYQIGNEKKIGCGQKMDWKNCEALDPIELQRILDSGVADFLASYSTNKEAFIKDLQQKAKDLVQHK